MSDLKKMLSLCKEREKEWPGRGKAYDEFKSFMNDLETNIKNLAKNNKRKFSFSKSISDKNIFIFGSMKSGTSLLLNLLDGHSKLATLPVDAHLLKHFNENFESKESFFEHVHSFWFRKLISPTGREPFLLLGHELEDYVKFSTLLYQNMMSQDLSNFKSFNIAARSYIEVIDQFKSHSNLIPVEKTPENEFKYSLIKNNFPHAKFVHIIRDPLINLSSCKKNAINLNYNFNVHVGISSILNSLFHAHINSQKNKNYYLLRYEDLINNTESEMKKVSSFLGIEEEAALVNPTYLGEKIKSNSMYKEHYEKMSVFKRNYDLDWNNSFNFLSKEEKLIVMNTFQRDDVNSIINRFGYINKFKK